MNFGVSGVVGAGQSTGKDALADLDALDVDHLLSYFQPQAGNTLQNHEVNAALQQQVPYRSSLGVGVNSSAQAPSANLFSSIALPDSSGFGLHDSGDSTAEGADGRGKRGGADKSQAIQEKNRRAQKRFRERQVIFGSDQLLSYGCILIVRPLSTLNFVCRKQK